MSVDFEDIKAQAEKEIKEEEFREAVDKCKERIKSKKWWHFLIPFKIVFIRRD